MEFQLKMCLTYSNRLLAFFSIMLLVFYNNIVNAAASTNKVSFLHVRNASIVDEQGRQLILKGVNVFSPSIVLREISDSEVRRMLKKCIFNLKDVEILKEMGVNHIRLIMDHQMFEDDSKPYEYKEEGFQEVDHILDLCESIGIYVILDMHGVPGGQNRDYSNGYFGKRTDFFKNREYQKRLIMLWRELAMHFENRKVVAAYDLINEPLCEPNEVQILDEFYHKLIKAIRTVDKKHIIVLEGYNFALNFRGLTKPVDDNIMLSTHFYYPGEFTGQKRKGTRYPSALVSKRDIESFIKKRILSVREKWQLPMWIGEFGAKTICPGDSEIFYVKDLVSLFRKYSLSWSYFNFKSTRGYNLFSIFYPRNENGEPLSSYRFVHRLSYRLSSSTSNIELETKRACNIFCIEKNGKKEALYEVLKKSLQRQ